MSHRIKEVEVKTISHLLHSQNQPIFTMD
uniref:Uncharacterized protein n=1 Tax=Nelumbo nucifera TaxID=4432 RepID=A0A822Z554_NELNU|nr:TPA_asm: hypothetical protein HUJ06_013153 [Nelumbo nucifera]